MDKEIEKQLDELREQKDRLELLIESAGWKELTSIMNQQKVMRRNEVFNQQNGTLDGVIGMANSVSELTGIDTVLQMPKIIIEEAQTEITALLDLLETAQENQEIDDAE
jgi:hypothetical protein